MTRLERGDRRAGARLTGPEGLEIREYTEWLPPGAPGSRETAGMDIGNIAELNTFLVLDAIRSRGQATTIARR